MPRSKTSPSALFAGLLAPVTDAVLAETGTRLTRPQWGRILRTAAAAALRFLARMTEPGAAPVVVPAVATEPAAKAEPVAEVKAEPVAPAPLNIPTVHPILAPFGWSALGRAVPTSDPVPVPTSSTEPEPTRNPHTKAAPKSEPKVAPSAARTRSKPAKPQTTAKKPKPAPAPKTAPQAKPAKGKAARSAGL